ncbi:MAG: ROK family protein [Acidobacteriaceae bacterium]|nr:ROK family protein [Acidobacteriaceae bacterium]
MKELWVGIDIGGTKTAVVVSANPPHVLGRSEFATEPEKGPEPAIAAIVRNVRTLVLAHSDGGIRGIGVSCGSPLDRVSGVIQTPPNLPTWNDVPITAILRNEFGAPCHLENDANAGAIAEFRYGAGRGARNMLFITMGTGFGAGVITDGRLYHGATDSAGEIGHVRLTPNGPVGYNKAGSAEGWASGGGIAQVAQRMTAVAQKRGAESELIELSKVGTPLTAKLVAEAAKRGDKVAQRVLKTSANRLGQALAICVDLFNPDRIVIGGIAMRLGDLLLTPARSVVRREALPHAAAACEITTAALGEQIGDIAAICVAVGLDHA